MFSYAGIIFLSSSILLLHRSDAFLGWIFRGKAADTEEIIGDNDRKVPLVKSDVQFEMATSDEKFLLQQHITKDLSPLDTCHHLVVAEIKETCAGLTEEELGKLAVQLLNCQLEAESRDTFACTRDMPIAECTRNMDGTMWNAYQIVSNRARAICYSTRQQQFRKKAEYTVNRLLQTTEGQFTAMKQIKEGQERINDATVTTLEKMEAGQTELMTRQEKLKAAQMNIHTYIASNLRELTREKALIATGNKELADMTESIRQKIDNATKKLGEHERSQKHNHKEVLNDLATIRDKARGVWSKIDESSLHVLRYHNDTTRHYEATLENLRRVNDTVTYMLSTIAALEDSLDKKLGWISTHLGGTGDRLSLLSTIVLHALYFLLAAVSVSFLQTPAFSRVVLLLLVPLNAWSEVKNHQSLGFTAMTLFIVLIVLVNWLAEWVYHRHQARKALTYSMTSDPATPSRLLAPCSSPETPVFSELNSAQTGLSTPDLRKLVLVIESLCRQGVLSPVSSGGSVSDAQPVNVPSPSPVGANGVGDRSMHPVDQAGDHGTPGVVTSSQGGEETTDTPQDCPPLGRTSLLDTSIGRDITESAKARVELVRRRLLSSPAGESPLARHRGSHLARSSSPRSSPARSSPRSSRASTPQRPLCCALTRVGHPCRNTCSDNSNYCFRHHPDHEDSDSGY